MPWTRKRAASSSSDAARVLAQWHKRPPGAAGLRRTYQAPHFRRVLVYVFAHVPVHRSGQLLFAGETLQQIGGSSPVKLGK